MIGRWRALNRPLALLLALAAPASATTVSVKLAWDPSPDSVAGYIIYYGPVGAGITNSITVGKVTLAEVPNLEAGVEYFFFATAFSPAFPEESEPSNTITYTPQAPTAEENSAPILAPIVDQVATVGSPLILTAVATDADSPAQALTFSLEAGAPAGATIDALTGGFVWVPATADAGTTAHVAVRVTDNGNPALSDTKSFAIVVNPLVSTLTAPGPLRALLRGVHEVELEWADSATGLGGYQIERSVDGVNYALIDTTAAASRSYTVTGPNAYGAIVFPYHFRIRSFKGDELSPYSNPVISTTNRADLIVSSIATFPTHPVEGQPLVFNATIQNVGRGAVPAGVRKRIIFDTGGGHAVAWADNVEALLPGRCVTMSATGGPAGTNTWEAVAGGHVVTAIVDDQDLVPEDQEDNNNYQTILAVASSNAPLVSLSLDRTNVVEGHAAAGTLTFTRSGSTAEDLLIRFGISGSALAGADYEAVSNTVVIPSGVASATLRFNAIDDVDLESTETITIQLVPSVNYRADSSCVTTLFLEDDDKDSDCDGVSDDAEVLAGTDPHDATSMLKVTSVRATDAGVAITWSSVPGVTYRVLCKKSPSDNWAIISPPIQAAEPSTSWTNDSPERVAFYTVHVEP